MMLVACSKLTSPPSPEPVDTADPAQVAPPASAARQAPTATASATASAAPPAATPEPHAAPPVPEDVKAPPATAKKTASGLAYRIIHKGPGKDGPPKATDMVKVNYTGWTTDGKMFDSSIVRGQPATFPLNGVIKGWTEGLQLMKVGDTARFWIPAALAYGEHPRPSAPAGMLVFDVELLAIGGH
jgi:peptidylprolyl isomerase